MKTLNRAFLEILRPLSNKEDILRLERGDGGAYAQLVCCVVSAGIKQMARVLTLKQGSGTTNPVLVFVKINANHFTPTQAAQAAK